MRGHDPCLTRSASRFLEFQIRLGVRAVLAPPAPRSTPPSSRLGLRLYGGRRLLLATAAALEPLDHGAPWAPLFGALLEEATGDRVAHPAAFARASLLSHALKLLEPTCSFNFLRGYRIALVALLVDRVERIDQGGFGRGQRVLVQAERCGDAGVPDPLVSALRVRPLRRSAASRACAAGRDPQPLLLGRQCRLGRTEHAPPRHRVVDRPAAGHVEHRVLRARAGSAPCQVLGQHVAHPAGAG
jgi:hypothetical protein